MHGGVHVADARRPGGVRANERRETDLPRLDRKDMTGAQQRLQETPLAFPERLGECPRPPLLIDDRPNLKALRGRGCGGQKN
jgi:hypothetical protein